MKNKNLKQLKVIPFCISLIIVLLITGGIGIYTTFYFGGTDLKFLDKHLGYENNKKLDTEDYIEKFVQLESKGYLLNSKETGLNYRNPETKEVFELNKNVENNYYNGEVMHVEGFCDIVLFTTLKEREETSGKKTYITEYTFYFFNIDYEALKTTTPSFQVAFVEGVGTGEEEYNDNEDIIGDLALEQITSDDSYGDVIAMEDVYTYNKKASKGDFVMIDLGAKIDGTSFEKINNGLNSPCVYSVKLDQTNYKANENEESSSKYFEDFENATFLIYQLKSENGTSVAVPMVEGTIENILSGKDSDKFQLKGYDHALHKVPTFVRYTWTTITIYTGIAFVVSAVLGILFYLIWVDEKQPQKKTKK